ncbi:hypothetical protein C1H46_017878 [Malus baccata]|uniref:Uncharacterized protein n=1 Tax=Malus baccata TaxID=106549 RepID=A0A540MCR2_MALBA|nr:hypothetical protein C1H46_017878 [Malus baccata]
MFNREVKSILEEMCDNRIAHNRWLKVLVNKFNKIGPTDRPRQPSILKNNPLLAIQVDTGFVWPKMIDLEKKWRAKQHIGHN